MQQEVIIYTPKENKEHPNFLPVINMTKVINELDYWCQENLDYSVMVLNIDLDDYWENIGTNLDINIWRPDVEDRDSPPKMAIYPVDDEGRTNSEKWYNIYDYTMDFLKNHPELETDNIKQWFQGID